MPRLKQTKAAPPKDAPPKGEPPAKGKAAAKRTRPAIVVRQVQRGRTGRG
jgi:hypothetical protein